MSPSSRSCAPLCAALLVPLGASCASALPTERGTTIASAPSPDRDALVVGQVGRVRASRAGVELSLPDRAGWSLDDAPPGLWLHGQHGSSGSALTARRWRLQGPATAPRCAEEGRAQLTKDFAFDRRAARLVDARTLEAPPGFRTVVETYVVVEAGPSGPAARGVLEAFGGGRRECFGFVFSTRSEGARGAELVGERLASVLERSVRSAHEVDSLGLPEPLETGRP